MVRESSRSRVGVIVSLAALSLLSACQAEPPQETTETQSSELGLGATADTSITMSANAAGALWGGSLAYTITATNAGPSAITGATVTDALPGTLKNVTWTCAASSGGRCAASGSGSILDTTVALPVGASVVYTVNVTVTNGLDFGQITNIATIANPLLVVDPALLDNAATVVTTLSSPNGSACLLAHDCSSNNCDLLGGGVCTPAGGCASDAECTLLPNGWCNTQTFACVAKLANGVAIPTIGGHTPALAGSCTALNGVAVCASGICDTKDNACGLAAGDAPCTVLTENVCRSGSCSVTGSCQAPGACSLDADCSGGNWCNQTSHVCTAKIANGNALPTDASHTLITLNGKCSVSAALLVCQSGVCDSDDNCGYANGDGVCTSATATSVCRSGACDGTDFKCGYANGDGPCTGNGALCRSNTCDVDGKCGYANGDGPCTSGNASAICRSAVCATAGPLAGKCESCASDSSCNLFGALTCDLTSATCVQCTALNATACALTTPVCNTATETCTGCNGDNGSSGSFACPSTLLPYCVSSGLLAGTCGRCVTNGDCGASHNGSICNAVTGSCGNTCTLDTDCFSSNEWCDSGSCVQKIPNGQLLPSDAPISGACTVANGLRVCVSGACDSDGKCGIKNGDGPCTPILAAGCRSNVCAINVGPHFDTCEQCGSDLDCTDPAKPACDLTSNTCVQCSGLNTSACTGATPSCDAASEACVACAGDDGTSAANACATAAAPYCEMSGACGLCTKNSDCGASHAGPICNEVTGACGSICTQDTDCTASQWCDIPLLGAGSCVPKLADGTHLPLLPLDVAVCTDSVALRVCASGVCDPTENRCGAEIISDAGVDSGSNAGSDAGIVIALDAGIVLPVLDAGSPIVDAGSPISDAGSIVVIVDAGSESDDAGYEEFADGGSRVKDAGLRIPENPHGHADGGATQDAGSASITGSVTGGNTDEGDSLGGSGCMITPDAPIGSTDFPIGFVFGTVFFAARRRRQLQNLKRAA